MNGHRAQLQKKKVKPSFAMQNGTPLADGDTVTVIKDLKIKGTNDVVKVGTKVKNIRLVGGDHDIDCKIPRHRPDGSEVGIHQESHRLKHKASRRRPFSYILFLI